MLRSPFLFSFLQLLTTFKKIPILLFVHLSLLAINDVDQTKNRNVKPLYGPYLLLTDYKVLQIA